MNPYLKGSLLLILATLMFAFIGPFIRWINWPSQITILITSIIALFFLVVYYLLKGKLKKVLKSKHKKLMVLSASLLTCNILLYYKALQLTTLANAVLTHYIAPVFAAVFASLYLKERIEKVTIVSLVLSFFGLYLIMFNDLSLSSVHFLGLSLGLLSALFYGVSIPVQKKMMDHVEPLVAIFYQLIVIIVLTMPFAFFTDFSFTLNSVVLSVVYVLLLIIGATYLFFKGIKYVQAQHVGIIAYAEPIAVLLSTT